MVVRNAKRLMGLKPTTFCRARAQVAGTPWPVTTTAPGFDDNFSLASLYSRRREMIEPVFGQIKAIRRTSPDAKT